MASDGPAVRNETREEHWNSVYEQRGTAGVSWYQPTPEMSLALIERLAVPTNAGIIDIGGGASRLAASLLARGFDDLTVLDVSARALELSQAQLGPDARKVQWLQEDLLSWSPSRTYDLWHDRAVFHFLIDPASQQRYVELLRAGVALDGHVILGTFALDGPEECSGLPVARYDGATLGTVLGTGFVLIDEWQEKHRTPTGAIQPFTWTAFKREM
jgi:SAM-dependent methyltransferase